MSNYSKPRSTKKEAEELQKYVGIYLDNCHKHGVKPTWDRLVMQASIIVGIPESRIRTDRNLQAALIQGRDNYYRMKTVHTRLNPPPKPKKKPAPKPTTQEELVPTKEQKPETQKQQLPKPEAKKEEGKQMAQPEQNDTQTLENAQSSIQAFVDSKPNGFTRAAYREFSKNRANVLSESKLRKFFPTWGEAATYAKKYKEQEAFKQAKKAALEKARPAAKKPVNKPAAEKPAPKKPTKKQDKPAPKATKPAHPKDTTPESVSEIVAEAFKNMRTEGSLLHQFTQFVATLLKEGYLLRDLLLVFEQNEISENKGSWGRHDAIIKHLDENPQDARKLMLMLTEGLHDACLQGSLNASK